MQNEEKDFNFNNLFIPLTTKKIIIFITIIGFLVFFNMLFNDFVGDDIAFIINNPQSHNLNILFNFGVNLYNQFGQYRPLAAIYDSLLYTFFGNNAFFYHLLQLLLHITCAGLIYIFFRKFLSSGVSFFLALIFLVHPIQIESVSYISASVVSPLFVLFGLISLLIATKKDLSNKNVIIIFTLLLLSILAKETGILFLVLLLFYSVLFSRKNFEIYLMGCLTIICAYSFLRIFVGKALLETKLIIPINDLTLLGRIKNIPIIMLYYIKTFFFPYVLGFDQQWIIRQIQISTFYVPLAIDLIFLILLCTAGLWIYKSSKNNLKPYIFFSAWFIAGLLFHLQIFPLDLTVAERWFYFPIIGLLGLSGIILQSTMNKNKKNLKGIFLSFAILIIVLLSFRTMLRNTDWQNNMTLYTKDVKVDDNYNIEENLALEYQARGEYRKALQHFQRSVDIKPNEANLYNIGFAYLKLGDFEKAKKYFGMVFNVKNYQSSLPNKYNINSYLNYIATLTYYNNFSEAKTIADNALLDYPESSSLLIHSALIKYKLNDRQGALKEASKAYEKDPTELNKFIYNNILNKQHFPVTVYGKSIFF